MQIRRQSWAIAALFLIAFCWLGFLALSFGALFKGVDIFAFNFPIATKFAIAYGPTAFPIFGIVAAIVFILSEVRGRNPCVQMALSAVFVLLILWAFSGLFVGRSFIGPPDALSGESNPFILMSGRPKSPGEEPCICHDLHYLLLMPLSSLTVAEEALSLSPEDREALVRLLIESLKSDSRADAEIVAEINRRLEGLLSNKDEGLAFHEVFGRAS